MRILIATSTYYPHTNGASYFTQRLAMYMAAKGHTVRVVNPSRFWRGEQYEHRGLTVIGFPSFPWLAPQFRIAMPTGISRNVRKAVKEFQPDIIHAQDQFGIGAAGLRTAKKLGIPSMATHHFLPENLVHYFHLPRAGEQFLIWLAWKHFCYVYEKAGQANSPTQTAADHLKSIGFRKSVLAISCGIDLNIFHPGPKDLDLLQQYGIAHDRPILLYVGRLDKEKNLDFVLRAFAKIHKDVNVRLVLAGKGVEAEKLKALARELNIESSVTFPGFIADKDLPALYRSADCFVIAGTAELQSIATLEAMASGLPVLGVNAVALPELVHDGVNGWTFTMENPEGLGNAIVHMFRDEERRKEMSRQSVAIAQPHAIEKTIERYEEVYQKLQTGHHPRA